MIIAYRSGGFGRPCQRGTGNCHAKADNNPRVALPEYDADADTHADNNADADDDVDTDKYQHSDCKQNSHEDCDGNA